MKDKIKKKIGIKWKIPAKWTIFGLLMGVVIATVGSVAALNGWFGGGGSIPEDTMTRGLVGYWGFEEGSGTVAHDASNYGNNATTSGTAPSWTKGKVGGALSFDGTDDRLDLGSKTSLNPSEMTLEAWVNLSADVTNGIIIRQHTDDFAIIENSGGTNPRKIQTWYYDTDGTVISSSAAGPQFSLNTWYHIVSTYDRNFIKLYVDGVLQETIAGTGKGIRQNSANRIVWIGAEQGIYSFFNGKMDEVRIYNRALSAEEVRYHYNRGGPVAHWKMDEGEGRTVYDSTENNNDGTLVLAGSATSSAWVSGKYGSALSFDGVDDYGISVNNIELTNPFTIEAWIRLNSVPASLGTFLSITSSCQLYVYSNSKVYFGCFQAPVSDLPSNSTIGTGEWHYVSFTYDGDARIYLNGSLDASGDKATLNGSLDAKLAFGRRAYNSSNYYFPGLIDDVRIYNYARTPDEIRLDYNAGFAAKLGPSGKECKDDPASCMTEGLVGYWDMEEGTGTTAHDSSNYANTGTLTAGPSWTKGKVGGALSFDGTDDYVDAGSNASLDIESAGTVEFWIKPDSAFIDGTNKPIIVRDGGTTWQTAGVLLYKNNTGDKFGITVGNGTNYNSLSGTTVLVANTWYHVAGTFDGSKLRLYVNGVKENEVSQTYTPEMTGQPLYFGKWQGFAGAFLDGLIDEVRIYNRALSAEEVRYHYNRGGPVAQWKMDEGEGRTVYDSTDNNNDGTLVLAGSATSSAWVSGKFGTALSFDGVDDYVSLGTTSNLNFTNNFSISAWIYPKTFGDAGYGRIFSRRRDAPASGYIFIVNDDTNALQFSGIGASSVISATNSIQSNVWQHVAMSMSNGTVVLYVNGVNQGSGTTIITGVSSLLAVIGDESNDLGTRNFNGLIDDVRIYNYARTPDEIRMDYNAGFAAHFGPSGKECKDDPASCMTEGLVGYWDMEEGTGVTIHDKSDNSNNGTTTNMATPWTSGIVPLSGGKKGGSALSFDGSNDYVDVKDSSSLDLTGPYTLEAWVKFDTVLVSQAIIEKNYGSGYGLVLWSNGVNGWLNFRTRTGGTVREIDASNHPLSKNTWYHWVALYDGSFIRAYVNGIEYTDYIRVATGAVSTNSNDLMIGHYYDLSGFKMDGLIDEVRVYNRALSAEEVRYHYNKGGPVAQWKMDEGEGRTVYDSTENNNDGTLVLAGSATSSAWVEGKSGGALSFDGVDDYVDVGHNSNLVPTTEITVEAWVKPKDIVNVGRILNKEASTNGYTRYILTKGTTFAFNLYNTALGSHGVSYTIPSAEVWYHVVGTFNGINVKLYVNGEEKDSKDFSGTWIADGGESLWIGRFDGGFGQYFSGLIDDVRIYNYARTQEQIRQDYNAGLGAHFK